MTRDLTLPDLHEQHQAALAQIRELETRVKSQRNTIVRKRWVRKGRITSMRNNLQALMLDDFITECERLQLIRLQGCFNSILDKFAARTQELLNGERNPRC